MNMKNSETDVTVNFRLITEHMARNMLRYPNKCRPLNKHNLKKITKAMEEERFICTGAGIVFDKSGSLLDGQTRLTAIKNTGKSQFMVIACGVEERAMFFL